MISSVITTSVLRQKADKRNVKNIAKASYDIQLAIYRETLVDLDDYLDTSNLLKLTSTSLNVIRDDILEIIKGIRDLRVTIRLGHVKSVDGTLEELRLARDAIQVAVTMFEANGQIDKSKIRQLLTEMRLTRKQLEKTLTWLAPA